MADAMDPDYWNILHDGYIVGVRGGVPGDVSLDVEINYLRERFSEPGHHLKLTLHHCTQLSYDAFEEGTFEEFSVISRFRPQILRAAGFTDASLIECVSGDLRVNAQGASLALDSGRPVSLDELKAMAEAYWTEWEQRAAERNLRQ